MNIEKEIINLIGMLIVFIILTIDYIKNRNQVLYNSAADSIIHFFSSSIYLILQIFYIFSAFNKFIFIFCSTLLILGIIIYINFFWHKRRFNFCVKRISNITIVNCICETLSQNEIPYELAEYQFDEVETKFKIANNENFIRVKQVAKKVISIRFEAYRDMHNYLDLIDEIRLQVLNIIPEKIVKKNKQMYLFNFIISLVLITIFLIIIIFRIENKLQT